MKALLWSVAVLLALPVVAQPMAWVSWVMDGDTVMLVPESGGEPYRLRLQGMDAPESCQSGGERSREALMALVQRRHVQVQLHGTDSYGRQLGQLWRDGQDVGAEMVRSGWAWAYSYRTGRGPYAGLQRQAQRELLGIFAMGEPPMSPALFRQFHGSCHADVDKDRLAPVQRAAQTGQAGSR